MDFFAGANTRYGFKSLFDDIFHNIEKVYILKGSSGCGKSTLMRKIGARAKELGLDTDMIYCSADPESLDGIIIPKLNLAVVDGTAPHLMDVKYPCVRDNIINLGEFWDENKLLPYRAEIIGLTDLKGCHYKNAYRALSAAGHINELAYNLISDCADIEKTDLFAFKIYEKLIVNKGKSQYIYASSFSSSGVTTLSVFENVKVLYKLSGKASAQVMNSVLHIAKEKNCQMVVCYNVLDPNFADAIYFPESQNMITAMSSLPCKNAKEIHTVSTTRFLNNYKMSGIKNRLAGLGSLKDSLLAEAQKELIEAKNVHNQIEEIYISAMDFDAMNQYTKKLIRNIFES